jgi:arylsulfatase A
MIRLSRRNFMKTAVAGAAATALGGCGIERFASEQSRRPNIIYILADDLGYGDVSCYGQEKFETPHIDSLANGGIKFTQHYAGSTVCAPSRCVLMTGLHTGHCFIRGNKGADLQPEGQFPMPVGTVTMPTLLRQAGYVSGMFGKWGLGYPGSVSDPMEYFDEFYGYNCQGSAHGYYPDHLWHNRQKVELDGKTYSHDLILNAAKDFIRNNKNQPFFCYMPVTIPHASMHAPKDLHDKYRKKFPQFENKIGKYYKKPDVQNPIAAFAAMVEHLDNGIGEILAMLKELSIDENTIVMFSSDNGPHREGGHDPAFFNSNGPFRGIKRDLYEGGIRVPFIARWPGWIKAGQVSDHISGFQDVLPTCTELAGGQTPTGIDGISFLPTLIGQLARQKQHPYLYWEWYDKQAVRKSDWKAVRLNVAQNPDAPMELYDLSVDIGEAHDVAASHPAIVEEMREIMDAAHTESQVFPFFPSERRLGVSLS